LEIKALESQLLDYKDSMRSLFFRRETHESACGYLTGLMGKIEYNGPQKLDRKKVSSEI
jgi:hypothetical protein